MSNEQSSRSRRNVEQKFRCHDLEAARASALASGALHVETMCQRDLYFRADRGRLKLRTIESDVHGHSCELIAYERPDGDRERVCTYHILPVSQPRQLEALLTAALGVRAIVSKHRRLLLSGNLRIHLDEVDRLGSFVEFEAVLGPDGTEEDGRRQIADWRTLLDLHGSVAVSYVDLLEGLTAGPPSSGPIAPCGAAGS